MEKVPRPTLRFWPTTPPTAAVRVPGPTFPPRIRLQVAIPVESVIGFPPEQAALVWELESELKVTRTCAMAPLVTEEMTLIWIGVLASWPAGPVSGCSAGVGWMMLARTKAAPDAPLPSVVSMKLTEAEPEVAVIVL